MTEPSPKGRSSLRHNVRDLVAKVVPTGLRVALRRVVKGKRKPTQGLPPGLDSDLLDEICQREVGARPGTVSYLQLSGWRTAGSGAFRVFAHVDDSRTWTCIYKNSVLTNEETPGLAGLPLIPGSEYQVYANAGPDLEQFIPRRLHIEEIETRVRHTVVLEDLQVQGYGPVITDKDVLGAISQLPAFHTALESTVAAWEGDGLYTYDEEWSTELRRLCRESLEKYQELAPDPAVVQVLGIWDDLEKVHDVSTFHDPENRRPAHGDANRANVLVKPESNIQVVDWEWAGWRLPQFDLASLLKGRSDDLTEEGIRTYASLQNDWSLDQHRLFHAWARLELRLLDSSYVIAQDLGAPGVSRMDLGRYLHVSAREISETVATLSRLLDRA
jgi:hypothetical protein